MNKPLELEIKLEPVPLARSRTVFSGGKVHSYTPQKTAEFQEKLRKIYEQYKKYYFPIGTPIKLTCVFYRTKSHWCKKAETIPARKPDLDNFLKQNDSMNKILFYDDSQISQICAKKRWTDREYPYIKIRMEVDEL